MGNTIAAVKLSWSVCVKGHGAAESEPSSPQAHPEDTASQARPSQISSVFRCPLPALCEGAVAGPGAIVLLVDAEEGIGGAGKGEMGSDQRGEEGLTLPGCRGAVLV